jgi:hypothetical protein
MRDTKWCSSLNLTFLFMIAIFLAEVSYAEGQVFSDTSRELSLPIDAFTNNAAIYSIFLNMSPVISSNELNKIIDPPVQYLSSATHTVAEPHSPGEKMGVGPQDSRTSTKTAGVVFHPLAEGETIGDPYNWLGTNTKGSGYSSPGGAAPKEDPNWWTQAATAGSKAPALVIGGSASAPMRSGSSANYPGVYQDSNDNYLWIENVQGRAQYSSIPQYSRMSLVASTSNGGQGQFYELIQSTTSPSTYNSYNINFQPESNQIGFDASIVGRHIMFYIISNQPSNVVIVDVGRG